MKTQKLLYSLLFISNFVNFRHASKLYDFFCLLRQIIFIKQFAWLILLSMSLNPEHFGNKSNMTRRTGKTL